MLGDIFAVGYLRILLLPITIYSKINYIYSISRVIIMSKITEDKYWGRFAQSYDQDGEYIVGKKIIQQISDHIQKEPHLGEVIEFGCGTGYFSRSIAQISDNLIATDLSDEMLSIARKQLLNFHNVTVEKADCKNTKYPSEYFDGIFMLNLIHVIEKPEFAIKESYRLLKNNGILIIISFTSYQMSLFNKMALGIKYLRTWGSPPRGGKHNISPDYLSNFVGKYGFKIDNCKIIGSKSKAIYFRAIK